MSARSVVGGATLAVTDAVARARASVFMRSRRIPCGPGARFDGRRPMLRARGRLTVGRNLTLYSHQFRTQITVAPGATLAIGDNVDINQGCNFYVAQSVTIGNDVGFADLVTLADTNFHEVLPGAGVNTAPIAIEDNVWVGRSVTILPGVRIGCHSVIGEPARRADH